MKNNIENKDVVPHRAVHLTIIDMPHLCLRTAFGKELLSYHFRETWMPHNAGSKTFMIQNANYSSTKIDMKTVCQFPVDCVTGI